MAGDKLAIEAFLTFIDGLKAKKLGKDGENALTVIVSVVELLLPMQVRATFLTTSDKKRKKKTAKPRRVAKKKRR